jgi:hypothetical protein
MRRVHLCLLTLPLALNVAATQGQQNHKANRKPPHACPAAAPTMLTQNTRLQNGDVMYYGRFLMYTPDGNSCAPSQRQMRLDLPRLQNDDPAHPTTGNVPIIQATIESALGVLNDQMIIYSIQRGVDSTALTFLQFDATAFNSTNTPTEDFYLNVTVIGHPVNEPAKE